MREKITRLTESRVSCALVLDREFSSEELTRFYRLPDTGRPTSLDFFIEGRVARYECDREDEAKWRLAFEIFLVKACRPPDPEKPRDLRERFGFRRLHVG